MNIIITELKFENFMSYEKGSYDFKNGIDLIVGTNGAGKSTSIDAIFFALFGKAYRKIKIGSLINKVKGKKLRVELYFNVDDKKYKVVRAVKPNKFEIYEHGEEGFVLLKEQASVKDYQKILEEEILRINETIFRQLISVSANLPNSKPFMELNAKEKEELFQIITDTSIFGDINHILSRRLRDVKQRLKDLDYKRSVLDSSIQSERLTIEQAEKRNEDFQKHHLDNIKMTEENISKTEETITRYEEGLEKLKKLKEKYDLKVQEMDEIKTKNSECVQKIRKIKTELQQIETAQAGAITCHDCGTVNYLIDVDVNLKPQLEQELQELETERSSYTVEISSVQDEADTIKEKLLNGKRIKSNLEEQRNNLTYYQNKLVELQQIKPVEINYKNLKEKEKDFELIMKQIADDNEELTNHETLENLVGNNNLKGQIVKSQVPMLNKEINYFLELFSMLEYHFVIDETFQERIISRDEDAEFQSLSNGQKARISFSIMFAFLKLIEERNGVKINILILDEILDSSVDSTGREELLNILKLEFSSLKDIIIISHNEEIKEKIEMFDRIVSIRRDKFSEMTVEEIK